MDLPPVNREGKALKIFFNLFERGHACVLEGEAAEREGERESKVNTLPSAESNTGPDLSTLISRLEPKSRVRSPTEPPRCPEKVNLKCIRFQSATVLTPSNF